MYIRLSTLVALLYRDHTNTQGERSGERSRVVSNRPKLREFLAQILQTAL